MPEAIIYVPNDSGIAAVPGALGRRVLTRIVNGVIVAEEINHIGDPINDDTVRILAMQPGPGDAAMATKDWANRRILDRMEFPVSNERAGTRTGLESQRSSSRG